MVSEDISETFFFFKSLKFVSFYHFVIKRRKRAAMGKTIGSKNAFCTGHMGVVNINLGYVRVGVARHVSGGAASTLCNMTVS